MRALFAAVAALLLSACAHPLEIRNLERYSSLARGEPLERQTVVGLVTSAPDVETQRLVAGVGNRTIPRRRRPRSSRASPPRRAMKAPAATGS
jgi:uncharacterized lipoprotein YajG